MAEAGHVEGGAADASANPSRARRVIHIVLAVLVAFVAPVLLLDALVGQYGANAMVLGVLVGALGSKIGGTRRMLYLAPAIGLAAGLGAFTAYDWWWVGLVAAAGVVAGAGIGFGWMLPLLMIPFVATFASPVSSGQHAVAYGVIAAVTTGYGIVLARRFGAAAVVEGQRVREADILRVELHQPIGSPAFVLLVWPAAPTVINANPKAIATIAATSLRIMADAQARLATLK